jgi:hypothetical protein
VRPKIVHPRVEYLCVADLAVCGIYFFFTFNYRVAFRSASHWIYTRMRVAVARWRVQAKERL